MSISLPRDWALSPATQTKRIVSGGKKLSHRSCQCSTPDGISENVVLPSDLKEEKKVKASKSFRFSKRTALQPIENRSECVNQRGPSLRKHSVNNVYVPLGELKKNGRRENQHNALNTISEVSQSTTLSSTHRSYTKVIEQEKNSHPITICDNEFKVPLRSKSRVKSFLVKSSRDSKYYNILPKLFDQKPQYKAGAGDCYASSKTISPKLLHSVSGIINQPPQQEKAKLYSAPRLPSQEEKNDIPLNENLAIFYVETWYKL